MWFCMEEVSVSSELVGLRMKCTLTGHLGASLRSD
jgi:hypothetical protein